MVELIRSGVAGLYVLMLQRIHQVPHNSFDRETRPIRVASHFRSVLGYFMYYKSSKMSSRRWFIATKTVRIAHLT